MSLYQHYLDSCQLFHLSFVPLSLWLSWFCNLNQRQGSPLPLTYSMNHMCKNVFSRIDPSHFWDYLRFQISQLFLGVSSSQPLLGHSKNWLCITTMGVNIFSWCPLVVCIFEGWKYFWEDSFSRLSFTLYSCIWSPLICLYFRVGMFSLISCSW